MKNLALVTGVNRRSISNMASARQNSSRLKPNPLRGSYESIPQLLRLKQENLVLRTKLKEFNETLNNLIEKNKGKRSAKTKAEPQPEENLETVKKRLKYYENEYHRLENRQLQLSDATYEVGLKAQVVELQQKLLKYEDSAKKKQGFQKVREKELNTVLDTGEKAELYKEFLEMNTEVSLYSKRYEKLQKLNASTAQSYKDMTNKLKGFEKEYDKIKDKVDVHVVDAKGNGKVESMARLEKKFNATSGECDSKLRVLQLKIKKLEEALEASRRNEMEIKELIEVKLEQSKNNQFTLNELQLKASYIHKSRVSDEFMKDDLMFLTERF